MISKRITLSFIFLFTIFISSAISLERCKKLINDIRTSHFYYFGVDFPYWYSVAQAEKESACRHNVLSTDGIGSEGFAQITYRWWQKELSKEGILEIKTIQNHSKAQAYINYYNYKRTVCKKLFEMYQLYNGSFVSKDLKRANSCKWEDGLKYCIPKTICVYKVKGECRQTRTSCDINYSYSSKIYKLSQKYKTGTDGSYKFF